MRNMNCSSTIQNTNKIGYARTPGQVRNWIMCRREKIIGLKLGQNSPKYVKRECYELGI
jgi:hypothetical protein